MSEFYTCPGCGQSLKRSQVQILPHFDAAGYPCSREGDAEPEPRNPQLEAAGLHGLVKTRRKHGLP